jgi:hypothetical protein
LPRLLSVSAQSDYRLWLEYSDGTTGAVDLSHLVGRGVFELWKNPEAFSRVQLSEQGAPTWNDSIDLCPDALYLQLTGKKPEDLFPNLSSTDTDA